ncbi:hypothetical protein HNY73_022423 [Argiope bruennichi]|uniref:Uncharacterized protein n=1 Tax=Argiope bruennichi TaxID=94029 RepID=A0A8T0E0U2_ARGBR|nr:hypothetical protein HNY73_022423 [Argiope bruennichi]
MMLDNKNNGSTFCLEKTTSKDGWRNLNFSVASKNIQLQHALLNSGSCGYPIIYPPSLINPSSEKIVQYGCYKDLNVMKNTRIVFPCRKTDDPDCSVPKGRHLCSCTPSNKQKADL